MKDRVGLCYQLAEQWKDQGLFRTCLNCSYWEENPSNEFQYRCQKNGQIPPPRIIAHGCENHSDLIPF